jgi:hypothetical protein
MGPSAYQKFTLDRARQAMYDALSPERETQTYVSGKIITFTQL